MAVIETLRAELQALGLCNGDVVLVHSSLNALRRGQECVEIITPQNVIDTLLSVIGVQGTLLMPALSYLSVTKEQNRFDQNQTKSCVGILPEIFRTEYAEHRSMHPTHSVSACGKMSEILTKDHILDRSPLGEHSPFRLLPQVHGKILMLGCGLRPMTFMHGVEEQFQTDYVMSDEPWEYVLRDGNGNEFSAMYAHHNFKGYEQRYDRLEQVMDTGLVLGKTLGATSYLLSSEKLKEKALETLEKDQHYFVDRVADR